MDSLTQIVLGAAVGEVVLGKKVGYRAALWGAIGGTIPDLDVLLSNFTTYVTGIYHHRGFSHSIVFDVLMAPIFGYLIYRIYKRKRCGWWDWTWLMFWAFFTHPVLDCFTTWGTRIFWPHNARVSFQNIFVADPLYTLPFMICLLVALLMKRENPKRSYWAWGGIAVSSLYMCFTFWSKGQANEQFLLAAEEQQLEVIRMESRPTPLNAILWTANIESEDAYHVAYYSLMDEGRSLTYYDTIAKRHEILDAYRGDEELEKLLFLTQGWYAVDPPRGDTIIVNDLRFGQFFGTDSKPFVFRYQITQLNGPLLIEEPKDFYRPQGDEFGEILSKLWTRIKGEV